MRPASSSPFADNYERIKQRNLAQHRETVESSSPRARHEENLDPAIQAEVDELRLSPEERHVYAEDIRSRFVRRHNALCGPVITPDADPVTIRQALDSAPEGRQDSGE